MGTLWHRMSHSAACATLCQRLIVNEADRIARERLRSQQEAIQAEQASQARDAAASARRQLDAIGSLSREVLALLAACRYRKPELEPEPVSLTAFRFPPLGGLFGYRRIVKGGWEIARWEYDREKPGHTVWLLADGRYGWNSRIVRLSAFADWHRSPYVSQGLPLMREGVSDLKAKLEAA